MTERRRLMESSNKKAKPIAWGNDLFDYSSLKKYLDNKASKKEKKIVFTAGVWDLLHEGHIRYLRKAKERGTVLVVGVDTDSWTKKRKGPSRPLVREEERIELLSELRSVGCIVLIDSLEDYERCISILKPDVIVISATTSDFPEKNRKKYLQHCKDLVIFEPQSATSTSSRLRNIMIDGGKELAGKIQEVIREHLSGGEE